MNPIDLNGVNMCTTFTGIRGVAGATTLTTTAAANYSVNGKAYTKAAATGGAAPTLDAATGVAFKAVPPGYGSVFAITLAAGTNIAFSAVQGEIVPIGANLSQYNAGEFITPPELPQIPDTHTPIGYMVVRVATDFTPTTGWVLGVSNTYETTSDSAAKAFRTGATGAAVAASATSCLTLPDRPQVA